MKCEPVDRMVRGESYQLDIVGLKFDEECLKTSLSASESGNFPAGGENDASL